MSARLAPRAPAPPIVGELIDVIGEPAFMALAAAVGGASFYVPRAPGPDHIITRAIGPEKAALVGEYFHGQALKLSLKDWRRRAILDLAARHSGDEIAARLRISRSYVYDVIAESRRPRERGLFD